MTLFYRNKNAQEVEKGKKRKSKKRRSSGIDIWKKDSLKFTCAEAKYLHESESLDSKLLEAWEPNYNN